MARRNTKAAAFLPLKPVWFHILVTLADEAAHGYAIRQAVDARTAGRVRLWPTTLYGALGELLPAGLIDELESVEGESDVARRTYQLTALGRDVLSAEMRRLEELLQIARTALGRSRS